MNASRLLAIAAFAATAALGAHAAPMGEGDTQSPYAAQAPVALVAPAGYTINRVATSPARPVATAGEGDQRSPYAVRIESTADRATVNAQAREAVRTGQIAHGEAGYM